MPSGLARHAADGRLLDAWFPRTNLGEHPESGGKILAAAGLERGSATLTAEAAGRLLETIHGINADTIRSLMAVGRRPEPRSADADRERDRRRSTTRPSTRATSTCACTCSRRGASGRTART